VSGDGFSNSVIGGQGALVRQQIMSPNFNLANPSASPTPSWAVLKNGLAYFFGLVLSGGTITGPDYIINSSGIFIYSGAPANGNLIGSWAGVAGTDAFGNAYPQGFNVTKGAISGTTFTGSNFVINSSGAFFYSGTPASGNLVASVAPAGGTDSFGNTFQAGFVIYGTPSGYIQLAGGIANPVLKMVPTGAVNVGFAPQVQGTVVNPAAANERLETVIRSGSPDGTTANSTAIILDAAAADASTVPIIRLFVGNTAVFAAEPALVLASVLLEAANGIQFDPISTPGTPGTGVVLWSNSSSSSLQSKGTSGMTGDVPAVQTDTSANNSTGTGLARVTKSWSINANDPQAGTMYRLTCGGYGTQAGTTAVNLTTAMVAFGSNFASSIQAAAQMPAGATFHWEFTGVLVIVSTGATGKARATGSFTWSQAVTGGTDNTLAGGQTSSTDITIDTTSSTTITFQSSWAAVTNSPTMTGIWSILERLGP